MANGLPPVVSPDLRTLLNQHAQEIFSSLNCHQLGTIVSFDAATQTASVSLNVQRVVYNQLSEADPLSDQPTPITPNIISYPVLVDCPVFVMSGGGSYVTLPIKAGDTCLVLFNDRDFSAWFESGAVAPPESSRMHSLSDGLALVGFRSKANALGGYSSDVVINSDALISLRNENTTLKACITTLFAALTGWVNTDSSTPNPATVTALTAAKAQFDSLIS